MHFQLLVFYLLPLLCADALPVTNILASILCNNTCINTDLFATITVTRKTPVPSFTFVFPTTTRPPPLHIGTTQSIPTNFIIPTVRTFTTTRYTNTGDPVDGFGVFARAHQTTVAGDIEHAPPPPQITSSKALPKPSDKIGQVLVRKSGTGVNNGIEGDTSKVAHWGVGNGVEANGDIPAKRAPVGNKDSKRSLPALLAGAAGTKSTHLAKRDLKVTRRSTWIGNGVAPPDIREPGTVGGGGGVPPNSPRKPGGAFGAGSGSPPNGAPGNGGNREPSIVARHAQIDPNLPQVRDSNDDDGSDNGPNPHVGNGPPDHGGPPDDGDPPDNKGGPDDGGGPA